MKNDKANYLSYDGQIGKQTWNVKILPKMEGLTGMRHAGKRFLLHAAGFIDYAEWHWKTDGDELKNAVYDWLREHNK